MAVAVAAVRPNMLVAGLLFEDTGNMKKIVTLVVAAMLLASAVGCNTCRSWFGRGSQCDPPECMPYGQAGVTGAPIIVGPGQ